MDIQILVLIGFFIAGYLAIVFESLIKINKSALALFLGVGSWLLLFFFADPSQAKLYHSELVVHLSDISELLFFLLGAMTIVELVDAHRGFDRLSRCLHTSSYVKMIWIVGVVSFFVSAILDNLTTMVLMIAILRKIVPERKPRMILLYIVLMSVNAGGAWTPIGDVTTTMLWIHGQLSTFKMIEFLFVPSLVCAAVPCMIYSVLAYKKNFFAGAEKWDVKEEPGAKLLFYLGVLGLLAVPVMKWLFAVPPYLGVLIVLGLVWIVSDILHARSEERTHLRVHVILTKVHIATLIFVLGILLAISALQTSGLLPQIGLALQKHLHSEYVLALGVGIVSSILDNIPLVAALMRLYDLHIYPIDSLLWMLIAYAAGTGGSLLLIGSSPGIALMGIEKIDFFSYVKKGTLPAFIGFLSGLALCYFLTFFKNF